MGFVLVWAVLGCATRGSVEVPRPDAALVASDPAVEAAEAALREARGRSIRAEASVKRAQAGIDAAEKAIAGAEADIEAARAELDAAQIQRDIPRRDRAVERLARARGQQRVAVAQGFWAKRELEARRAGVSASEEELSLRNAELQLAQVDGLQRRGEGDAFARQDFTRARDRARERYLESVERERAAASRAAEARRRYEDARREAGEEGVGAAL